jgi:hypothetical protein
MARNLAPGLQAFTMIAGYGNSNSNNNKGKPNTSRLNVLAQVASNLLEIKNTNVNKKQGAAIASAIFKPPEPDIPGKNTTNKSLDSKIPEVQVDIIDDEEDEETSVLLPPYVSDSVRSAFIRAWKGIVSGQAFTGSYLEQYAQVWVNKSKVGHVYDCERELQKSYADPMFKQLFLDVGFQNETKNIIYLKSKFSLKTLNAIPAWGAIEKKAKGVGDVEPDIIVWSPPTANSGGRPVVNIIEMKIGKGKKDGGEEYNQLCRVKALCEMWMNEYAKSTTKSNVTARTGWKRPIIKLWFCGWAAKTNADVVFQRPGKTMGIRDPVTIPYNSSSQVWNVEKINAKGFGELTGIRAEFISKIIEELNYKRALAFNQVWNQMTNPNTNIGRKFKANREANRREWNALIAGAVTNEAVVEFIKKTKSKKTAPTASAANAEREHNIIRRQAPLEAAIRSMLVNASKYNPAKVTQVINELVAKNAPIEKWTSVKNYINKNAPARTAPIITLLKNRANVGNNKFNSVFGTNAHKTLRGTRPRVRL